MVCVPGTVFNGVCGCDTCPDKEKPVDNFDTDGALIGQTCCPDYKEEESWSGKGEDECGDFAYHEAETCSYSYSETVSSVGAINGQCCTSTRSGWTMSGAYETYSRTSDTREILDRDKGLKCIQTLYTRRVLTSDPYIDNLDKTAKYDGSYTSEMCNDRDIDGTYDCCYTTEYDAATGQTTEKEDCD